MENTKMALVRLQNNRSGKLIRRRREVLLVSESEINDEVATHIIKFEYSSRYNYVVIDIEFFDIESIYEGDFDKVIDIDHYGEEDNEEEEHIDYSDPDWEMHRNGLSWSDFI